MTNKIHKASTGEILRIAEVLKTALVTEGGVCYYKDNWDDFTVAKAVGDKLSAVSVSRVRREVYGNFRGQPPKTKAAEKHRDRRTKVADLEEVIRVLNGMVSNLTVRVSYLENQLGVSHPEVTTQSNGQ